MSFILLTLAVLLLFLPIFRSQPKPFFPDSTTPSHLSRLHEIYLQPLHRPSFMKQICTPSIFHKPTRTEGGGENPGPLESLSCPTPAFLTFGFPSFDCSWPQKVITSYLIYLHSPKTMSCFPLVVSKGAYIYIYISLLDICCRFNPGG